MDSLMMFLLLPALILFFRLFFHYSLRRVSYNKFSTGNNGLITYPFIGCLISFYKNRTRLLDWFTHLLTKSPTQTIVLHRLGAPRNIITANPENVEYIVKTNFANFPKGKPFTEILGDFLGRGIFNVDGELWHTQRKLASHEFTTKSLRELLISTLQEELEQRLLPILESAMDTGRVIDLQDLLGRFTFDTVCKLSLGHDPCVLNTRGEAAPPALAEAFDVASEISARRGAAPLQAVWKVKRALCIGSERQLKEAIQQIHSSVGEMIDEKKRKSNGADLLSRLIKSDLDDEVIRDMAISFIMAGKDTTSAAMTWLLWLLCRHSDVEEEVVNETEKVVNGNGGSTGYDELKEMRLLQACLCESMRLYPPVAWDSKHAVVDDTLPDGTKVRRGDRVTYFPYGMGRMEALWGKDRLQFRPDRWFDNEGVGLRKVSPFMFPVFQAGPRVCLGKEMAFIQMKYVVASILRRFRLRPVRLDQPTFVPLLTAHMAGGFKVRVHSRNSSLRFSSSLQHQTRGL